MKNSSLLLNVITVFFLHTVCLFAQTNASVMQQSTPTGAPAMNTVAGFFDRLPLLPQGGVQCGQFSSHSPHQRNGDSGHFLYRDEQGDAVIFDVSGPGCITNIWGTSLDPEGILMFYFDGEDTPRYSVRIIDFYKGDYPDFPAPFLSYERRGYYLEESYAGNSFLPITFTKSLRISMKGKPTFYHILYEKYPFNTPVEDGTKRKEFIRDAINLSGKNPWAGASLKIHSAETTELAPMQSIDLLKLSGVGAVRTIEIEMDARKELLRDLRLMMIWDDETMEKQQIGKTETLSRNGDKTVPVYEKNELSRQYHVNAPIGFFFGSPHQPLELTSLPLAITKLEGGRIRLSCFFTMPYWRNARITVFNKSNQPAGRVTATVTTTGKVYPRESAGYFVTHFREGMTEYGRDWVFADVQGTGWFLGVVQSCRLEHYCEGNEHFYMDGNRTPQINGTGTEDYYLGCFWPNMAFNTPFAGCVNDVRIEGGGDPKRFFVCLPTDYTTAAVYYRFHLDMPLPFYSSMNAHIQHGAESQIESEYASLAYLYVRRTPALQQTDYLDTTNPASRKMHDYASTGDVEYRSLAASYEGGDLYTLIRDAGVYHRKGDVSFRVAINQTNRGVRIRRRMDQAVPQQKAEVYVDGVFAGTWYDAHSNDVLRWYDSEFNIHPDLTRGKESIEVKLLFDSREDFSFTGFEYIILCHTPTTASGQLPQRWKLLSAPDTTGIWVQPTQGQPALPVWGHAKGMTVGLAPLPGPRGLIRIYTPYLGLETTDVMNFIALEPIPKGSLQRGFSELEMSSLDEGRRGKRFWSANDNLSVSPLSEDYPARGVIEKINNEETLSVYVFSEPFDNGAKVYVRLRFYESRPYEIEITTCTYDDSVDLDYFIPTATMGNKPRLRTLYLKNGQKTSLAVWPDYRDIHFTPHEIIPANEMIQGKKGSVFFIAAPNEKDYKQTVYTPETTANWRFKGVFATQYWIKEQPDAALQGLVNGRFTYWAGQAPIPGGIAYENFELKEPFTNGSCFVFGITPAEPDTLINQLKKRK